MTSKERARATFEKWTPNQKALDALGYEDNLIDEIQRAIDDAIAYRMCMMVDRLGGDGVCLALNNVTSEEAEESVYQAATYLEKRAREEEREACAVAVMDANHWFVENTGRTASFAAQHAVSNGVDAIRARGTK